MGDRSDPVRILVSSAGRRVELVDCFRAAADRLGVPVVVHCSDLSPQMSPACHVADHAHELPACLDPSFADAMLAVVEAAGIDLVIPTIDTELFPLDDLRAELAAAGATVVLSERAALDVARDKLATWRALAGVVEVPATIALPADSAALCGLGPRIVVKPIDGSSSVGVRMSATADDIAAAGPDTMAQEQIDGREFTVNCYVDRTGRLLAAVPHERLAVRSGEVSKGRTLRHGGMHDTATQLHAAVPGLRGPFSFQLVLDAHDRAVVFEINARFGGGYPLTDQSGAPYAEWVIREHLGLPLDQMGSWRSGVTMLRFDRSVYLE